MDDVLCLNDFVNFQHDRVLYQNDFLNNKSDEEQMIVPWSKIISLFQDYNSAFSENDIASMIAIIQELADIAKKQPIYYFKELEDYSLSQIINQSLYLPNLIYHSSLLDFFLFSFKHGELQFINSFVKNDLFVDIINSILLFPDNESILPHSFAVINEVTAQSRESNIKSMNETIHQLIKPEFLETFLDLFRRECFSIEAKIEMISIIKNSSHYLSIIELNNLLSFLRKIFEDESLNFLYPKSFEILNELIQKDVLESIRETAEYIMIEKEFHIVCTKILLNTDCKDIIESISYFLKLYFKQTSTIFPDIDITFNRILQLSIENELLLRSTFSLFNRFLHRKEHVKDFIQNVLNFDKFQFLKNYYQEASYCIKKKILKFLSLVIPELTDEQIVEIVIPLNFMEDFVQILDANDLHLIFNKFIGIITRLLRRKISYNPPDVFWIQFEECGGVKILEDISNGEEKDIANRASCYLKNVLSLRPVYE